VSPKSSDGVSVCIVSYNTRDELVACLLSLREVTHRPLEVIVWDNASSDGCADVVRERFPEVRLVESRDNLGFGVACNRAAAMASHEWLLFLNPDTTVTPGFIEPLLDLARRHPEGGLYGGRTLRPDGSPDPRSCWGLPSLWSLFCFATGLSTIFARSPLFDPESLGKWPRDTEREVGVVTGCLLLACRDFWDRLGGFDETYFVYGEDSDLSLRARRAGARPRITPDAVITHSVGASSTTATKMLMLYKGKATYVRKNFPRWQVPVALGLLRAGIWLRARSGVLRGGRAGNHLSGYVELWGRRREWLRGW
jgi:N-acetylglucosaminyl-diphospho-decaprenol L-rhamnosyltransferase